MNVSQESIEKSRLMAEMLGYFGLNDPEKVDLLLNTNPDSVDLATLQKIIENLAMSDKLVTTIEAS